ncbi:cadherin EGF LAG seven-pass G-type receptor 1-like [Mya arenaria]|uniref:cadherin EGF LAG seven-pass G-type receptor 1-like n=1 Tax=Mya arenaria TaxID=6604 RepID=UPI0022E6E27E|nr:cadherin EGF LAG seven-pass G-type receptor 1-like [Mya arenaria]XP_052814933.1 cadherin EGF LAG seven-pass G-type receptor 1-like [Mya arenaria]
MDLRMFAACLIMTVFLIKHSDAAITQWQGTQADGSALPTFPGGANALAPTAISLSETATGELFTITATDGSETLSYTFADGGNPSSIADNTIPSTGIVTLATGKSLDFETGPTLVFKIIGTSTAASANTGTATLTLSVTDATVWTQSEYVACLSATSMAAGESIGTYASTDATSAQTVAYTISGGTDQNSFAISSTTGALTVAASKTLETTTKYLYTVELTATVASVTPGTTNVYVALECSSGAGQITGLLGALLMSVLTTLFR